MSLHIVSNLNIVSIVSYQKHQPSSRNEQEAAVSLTNTSMKSLCNVAWSIKLNKKNIRPVTLRTYYVYKSSWAPLTSSCTHSKFICACMFFFIWTLFSFRNKYHHENVQKYHEVIFRPLLQCRFVALSLCCCHWGHGNEHLPNLKVGQVSL